MEARIYPLVACLACLLSLGASSRTENFIVTASSPELSREVAETAEAYRRDLALEWLGEELPAWRDPCPITVHEGSHLGAGGATSFMFENRRPFGWTMTIQGSRERILDSVLPHEVTHTIFATHFGRPLPRWADEGACTTVEHSSEKNKQKHLLIEFLQTNRGIAFNNMFRMKEYPPDVLPLYSQGYSLARYLIQQGGKRKFVDYVGAGMQTNDWSSATRKFYGFDDLSDLQVTWLDWVRQGSPRIDYIVNNDGANEVAAATPSSRPSTPVQLVSASELSQNAQAGETETATGWYARVRDQSLPTHTEPAPKARRRSSIASANASHAAAGNGTVNGTAQTQSTSRPQPIGRAQTRVLQWSNEPPRSATQPRSYLVPRGSILR